MEQLITERRLSNRALAEATGISVRSLQFYAKMQREPSMSTLITLADYFDVSIDYLVGRSDERAPRGAKRKSPSVSSALHENEP